jgi:quercetin dioxygenase-like cupin family protein
MIHRTASGEVMLDQDGVVGTKLNEQNGCQYVHLTVQPGSVVAPHSLPIPVTFYVLAGNGALSLNGGQYEAEQGDLVEVEAGASRGWQNQGDAVLSLLVIKHME